MPFERRWLSYAETAERLGVTTKTIANMASAGRLPVSRPPHMAPRIDWKQVERNLEAHVRNPRAVEIT